MSNPGSQITSPCQLTSGRVIHQGNSTSAEPDISIHTVSLRQNSLSITSTETCTHADHTIPSQRQPIHRQQEITSDCHIDLPDFDPQNTLHSFEMAENSNSLLPSPFYGKLHEDIIEFINFELWATYRRADRDARICALPLLLKEGASSWYHTQCDRTK